MKRLLKKAVFLSILLAVLVLFSLVQLKDLEFGKKALAMEGRLSHMASFRALAISVKNYTYLDTVAEYDKETLASYAAYLFVCRDFSLEKREAFRYSKRQLDAGVQKMISLKADAYETMQSALWAVFSDAVCFPVRDYEAASETYSITYEDSWMAERTYGGNRSHEGTDLMAELNQRGLYQVLSVSDGVVEKIGWLPQGGYRIGIRSKNGVYFYYAHLASYEKEFAVGEEVKAGTVLGKMGDSGYGEEGTVGQFPVHLHFGIYLNSEDGEEISLNPYFILKLLQQDGS